MNKNYEYRIQGVDGEDNPFDFYGQIYGQYNEAWDLANRDAMAKILALGSKCPIRILEMTITNTTDLWPPIINS